MFKAGMKSLVTGAVLVLSFFVASTVFAGSMFVIDEQTTLDEAVNRIVLPPPGSPPAIRESKSERKEYQRHGEQRDAVRQRADNLREQGQLRREQNQLHRPEGAEHLQQAPERRSTVPPRTIPQNRP